ncbi:MAG TPA: sterol desaturase family protein [Chitinophagales bacterium]|nr:sterol desaturase family protein [Chitinophagales bacterium]
MSLIIYAIPVFFLLIGIELLIAKMRHLSYYRMNDAVANLSCGIGSQISGIFTKTFTFIGYTWLYQHSIWKIEDNALTFILLFIGVDFFYYWFHRLAHEISFLWGSHIVHHQSEEYNLTVALRQAWLQGAFSWVFYLPLAVVGFSPATFITIASLQTLYQFWIHTKLIGKMHPAFEYVFNTPSHHRVHHGVNPKYIDKNHGGTLIIFDRWFNTFQPEEEEVVYGITKQTNSWNPLWVNFEYWIDLFRQAFKVSNIKNFFLMMFKAPGWKPAELGGVEPLKEVSPQTFHKYNTEISSGLTNYAFFQFVIVLLSTTVFLVLQGKSSLANNWPLKTLMASLIILSLVNIGGIFERKTWVLVLEYLRIVAVAVLVILLFKATAMFATVTIAVLVLGLLSMLWFTRYRGEFNTGAHANGVEYVEKLN